MKTKKISYDPLTVSERAVNRYWYDRGLFGH